MLDRVWFERLRMRGYSRNGSEHALVETEENVRESAGAIGLGHCLLEANHGEITKEGVSSAGEGEGVAPEEPLEAHDGATEHGQEEELEGGLAASETTVEETDTGDHEQDEGGAHKQEAHVSSLEEEVSKEFTDRPA
jgi:hypothetical protein